VAGQLAYEVYPYDYILVLGTETLRLYTGPEHIRTFANAVPSGTLSAESTNAFDRWLECDLLLDTQFTVRPTRCSLCSCLLPKIGIWYAL
jgi:hypothetical protein